MENNIYDHYKETCEIQRGNENKRNKYFIYICSIFLLLMLISKYPTDVYTNFQEFVSDKFGINLQLQISIIETALWILAFYFVLTYYQINANIEKRYPYIHDLEKKLKKISRESKNYLETYPVFQNIAFYFYKYIFPLILSVCVIIDFINTINSNCNIVILIFKGILFAMFLIINVSYIHFNLILNKEETKK